MAFVTNQPLKARPQRLREHNPIGATISVEEAITDEWCSDHGVISGLRLTHGDSHQTVLFTKEDLIFAIPRIFSQAPNDTKLEILKEIARNVDAATLYQLLSHFFAFKSKAASRINKSR